MSWKVFVAFVAGLVLLPLAVIALVLFDDLFSKRQREKWLAENRWDGSCPLPACKGRPMCNYEGREPCDVLLAIHEHTYRQLYDDE